MISLRAFLILCTFVLCDLCFCQLRIGDEGVCVTTKFQQVRIGRGKTMLKQLNKTMCCEDWKFDFASKKCVFYCRLGCDRGKCVGPNKCSCEPPHVLVNDKCVEPVCEQPCVNAKCAVNNTCICDSGFEKINSTHCAPKCKPGYERPCTDSCDSLDDPFTCLPKCEYDCINGDCVEPNVCKCKEGYQNETEWSCTPICDACLNGDCIAPHDCRCHDGFKNESGVCSPICKQPCTNGFCSAPDICSCNPGYKEQIGVDGSIKCEPICTESCDNGFCESPENCACLPGYFIANTSRFTCYKECDGPCDNGVCTVNGVCECDHDFKLESGTCVSIVQKVDCLNCTGNCSGVCGCADNSDCAPPPEIESAEVASSARLAGLELFWLGGGAIGLLFLTMTILIIGHMWKKRKNYGAKSTDDRENNYGSVVYTLPNTLLDMGDGRDGRPEEDQDYDVVNDPDPSKAASEALLEDAHVRHEGTYT
ncbi:von Willebrand factor D and EGF domain-containing protein-like [Battus philenor]|uniref:von Willebrand factor D and EGF domain-containing protein-like n=1 Tax=Battus philenor TaxID=42288 RepID=UPI0035CEF897